MGFLYFSRLSTTKVVSRNGTANRISGSTKLTTAGVLTEPSTITQPINRPSRFEPQSPMKLDAGGKLWIRKPSAAPAVSAASTPGAVRPRSNAITASAAATIVQTPAASPSTPSLKLTTFISATSPTTVTVPPAWGKLNRPTNGNVM